MPEFYNKIFREITVETEPDPFGRYNRSLEYVVNTEKNDLIEKPTFNI